MSVSANVYGHQAQPSSSTARRGETDFPDNSNFLITPAPRGECESSPQSRLNCALPLGAGALGRASAFLQRARLGLPPPPRRARCIECASIVPCLSSRSAGRSPFKVCSSAVDVCFAFPTDFPRGRGRRGRRSRPKPSAAIPSQTSLLRSCRARFSAFGGRRPLSIERDTTAHD